jgi:hypothetical protein
LFPEEKKKKTTQAVVFLQLAQQKAGIKANLFLEEFVYIKITSTLFCCLCPKFTPLFLAKFFFLENTSEKKRKRQKKRKSGKKTSCKDASKAKRA